LGKAKSYVSLSHGWALGSRDFKKALLKEHAIAEQTRGWDAHGRQELQQLGWADALQVAQSAIPKEQRADTRKSAPWKVALATYLKKTGFYVSKHVGLPKKQTNWTAWRVLKALEVNGNA
jgi:putative transposase